MKTTSRVAVSRVLYEQATINVLEHAVKKLAWYLPDYQVIEISLGKWGDDAKRRDGRMKPEAITYHYKVTGEWEPIAQADTKKRFRPDTLQFSILSAEDTGEISVCDVDISGLFIRKDGVLGTRRLLESFYTYEQSPEFAKNYFDEALREVRIHAGEGS